MAGHALDRNSIAQTRTPPSHLWVPSVICVGCHRLHVETARRRAVRVAILPLPRVRAHVGLAMLYGQQQACAQQAGFLRAVSFAMS